MQNIQHQNTKTSKVYRSHSIRTIFYRSDLCHVKMTFALAVVILHTVVTYSGIYLVGYSLMHFENLAGFPFYIIPIREHMLCMLRSAVRRSWFVSKPNKWGVWMNDNWTGSWYFYTFFTAFDQTLHMIFAWEYSLKRKQ